MNPRIIADPNICGGDPCIAGTRIPVQIILGHLAAGDTPEVIIKEFPRVTREDVEACLAFEQDPDLEQRE